MADFKNLFSELFDLEDAMDKYQWIIDYGTSVAKIDPAYCVPSNMVSGCTSNLWVVKNTEGKLLAQGDSYIVNGIANMICNYYNQASIEQKQELSLSMLANLGLNPLLSMGRQNGVANLITRIKAL